METFKFRCVFCRQKIEAQEEWDGMFAECPSCGKRIEIRRDEEFIEKPPLPSHAPIPPVPDSPPTPTTRLTFQKPFPPKAPQTPPLPAKARTLEKPVPEPPEEPVREEEPEAPDVPEAPDAPDATDAPKPFPKPFTLNLPKWELPGKDGAKK